MSDDELKLVTTAALKKLFGTPNAPSSSAKPRSNLTPLSSLDLLTHVMTTKMPPGLLPNKSSIPRLKLTDLSRFEKIIEDLARTWEYGRISYSRERTDLSGQPGDMMIWEVTLGVKAFGLTEGFGNGEDSLAGSTSAVGRGLGKRKRVVDEDADSASGGEYSEDDIYKEEARPAGEATETVGVGPEFELNAHGASGRATSNLGSLSKELREVYTILQRGTAKGRLLAEQFRSTDETFDPVCPYITKDECAKVGNASGDHVPCSYIHFRPLIRPHTDVSLGHCSYLNTCYSEPTYAQSPSMPPFPGSSSLSGGVNLGSGGGLNLNMTNARGPVSLPSGLGAGGRGKEKAPCRYLHFELDWDGDENQALREREHSKSRSMVKKPYKIGIGLGPLGKEVKMLQPQWINCDLRRFDYSVLGKFHVIMADPPWDIHMSLPYGTMTDDEMKAMPIPALQDEGLLFLWVTGRAMEVGRECLRVWGYTRIDEVIWVKTNQLQRVIRTGRTGHWLNHTKEHMLVGLKNSPSATQTSSATAGAATIKFPSWINRGLDTDVVVSEVRETSRKPDEVYGMIERMCPGGRKVEIFGRKHNVRPGWLTLGNQLGNVDMIWEEDLRERIKKRYPERVLAGVDDRKAAAADGMVP